MRTAALTVLLGLSLQAQAAPDEQTLCKDRAYPVGTDDRWFFDECLRVGSFSHQADIAGLFGGRPNVMQPAARPLVLPSVAQEPACRWSVGDAQDLTVDDYMQRQRVMALLVVHDGVIQFERYQYGRTAAHRFVSQSMAKTLVALAVGLALREGRIQSLDDRADHYAPALAGTLYGETTLRHLLRMSSGVRFEERYDGQDDLSRYMAAVRQGGIAAGARTLTQRQHPQGRMFSYASAETDMLALVLRQATGQNLSTYLQTRLWQPMGAAVSGLWRAGPDGLERANGNFNATARDYARLGILLANDGVRQDRPDLGQILPRDFLLEATDWHSQPLALAPGRAAPDFGYGYQVWTLAGEPRRFALRGVYGQAIFVDPAHKLVMVQLAASATAETDGTPMGRDMLALWQGLSTCYSR